MSNWTTITIDDLKAGKHGSLIDAAATEATGATDPIAEAIGDAVARVRSAVSVGNQMDRDATAIPRSLRALCVRIAIRALSDRIGLPLTEDQKSQRQEDASYLNRIGDQKIRFEAPDNPDGSAEMQSRGAELAGVPPPRRSGREQMKGL